MSRVIGRSLRAAAATAGLLLVAIAVVMAPDLALGGLVLAAFVGLLADLCARSARAGEARQGPVGGRRAGPAAGMATFAAWLVVTGLVILIGPVAWILLLAVLLAGAAWWASHSRGAGGGRPGGGWPAELRLAAAAPAELSTPELCALWRRSCRALDGPDGGLERVELVRVRAGLLDELERRDREGFTRWLEAGPGAVGDPARYLSSER
jgi:hypothetical protein